MHLKVYLYWAFDRQAHKGAKEIVLKLVERQALLGRHLLLELILALSTHMLHFILT